MPESDWQQLTTDGREVPTSEVDVGPERETDPRLLRIKREVRRLHDVVRGNREKEDE